MGIGARDILTIGTRHRQKSGHNTLSFNRRRHASIFNVGMLFIFVNVSCWSECFIAQLSYFPLNKIIYYIFQFFAVDTRVSFHSCPALGLFHGIFIGSQKYFYSACCTWTFNMGYLLYILIRFKWNLRTNILELYYLFIWAKITI